MWGSTLESNAKQQIGLQLWGRKNRGFEEKKRKKKKAVKTFKSNVMFIEHDPFRH